MVSRSLSQITAGAPFCPQQRREPISPDEIKFVLERRARVRASWADCARMLCRSEADVRQACDPEWPFVSAARGGARAVPTFAPDKAAIGMPRTGIRLRVRTHLAKGPRTTAELAEMLDVSQSSAGMAVGRLVESGLIKRVAGPDLRRPVSTITDQGREVLDLTGAAA